MRNLISSQGLSTYLLRDNLLTPAAMKKAIEESAQQNLPLSSYLVRTKILSSEQIFICCAKHFDLPQFDLSHYEEKYSHDTLINPELLHRHRVIPLHRDEHYLQLGIADPTNEAAVSALSFHTGLRIQLMLVSESALDKLLSTHYCASRLGTQLESTLLKITPIEEHSSHYDITNSDDEPVSELVNRLIHEAIEKKVSDIHIEPFSDHCRIRFRRDGILYEAASTPPHLAARIITRLKIMSNLNIAERRLPQDGRLPLAQALDTDIRINTCPTLFGEKIVLRILAKNNIPLDIDVLGMLAYQKELFISKLAQPQGLILVTGPTGSGKTITLYSALNLLNNIEKNISSVEDPVEIEFAGINQINIHPRIGLDFALALRTLLRQDPDIIMLGEIRDLQTANIAMQAAQTGHLVLSTLHTNSAVETIARLQSIGVAPYHFISSISLIIAQRLIRKLCELCKQPLHDNTFQAAGCEHCHQGYQGRMGIFECIPMTEKIAKLILSEANTVQLCSTIKQEKWPSLWEAGLEKINTGQTSYAELIRVLGSPS